MFPRPHLSLPPAPPFVSLGVTTPLWPCRPSDCLTIITVLWSQFEASPLDELSRSGIDISVASVELTIHGQFDGEAVKTILATPDLNNLILYYAAVRLFERDAKGLDMTSLRMLASGVANVPSASARAVDAHTPPVNAGLGGTAIRFYVMSGVSKNRGISAAGTVYKALRFIQTQAYATHSKFYLLFTAPETDALAMSMLQERVWRDKATAFVQSNTAVKALFNVEPGSPTLLQSRGKACFTFITWDENFFHRADEHLDGLFSRLNLTVEQNISGRF